MLRQILVPLDGSDLAQWALPFAARLARAVEGRLILLRVIVFEVEGEQEVSVQQAAEADLARLADRLREQGSQVDSVVEYVTYSTEVADRIRSVARDRAADQIVISTHGRGGLGRWLYGSVADAVLRESELPVLLISAACDQTWPDDRRLRFLVPLDGSMLSEQVLGPATELADAIQADLLLLQVAAFPVYPAYPEAALYLPLDPELEVEEAKKYLEGVAAGLRSPGRVVDIHAELGNAPSKIVNVARERQIDLIAMATHGRGGIARFALGSVATGVVQQARVPTLLVRAGEVDSRSAEAGPQSEPTTP